MAHILDRLVVHEWSKEYRFREFIEALSRAEMIMADNVYSYYFDTKGGMSVDEEGLRWNIDFPAVAPPFPVFFVGTEVMPKGIYPERWLSSAGCLFVTKNIMDTQEPEIIEAAIKKGWGTSRVDMKAKGIRWIMYALPFGITPRSVYMEPAVMFAIPITEKGEMAGGWAILLDKKVVGALAEFHGMTQDETISDILDASHTVMFPALLAISFMHCRNVEVTEHLPNRKQSEKRERKRGHALIKFRTLQIEPIKKVLREEGQIESGELGVALHICRGHFKDYRDGKGLFGKHKEMYWWDMQSRGSADLGTVLKDYQAPPIQP